VSKSKFENIEFRVPGHLTQQAISKVLTAYDDLIENNRRRIGLLEEAARLLYREWFIHHRFPGHEHVPIIDGLPEGWVRTTLGEVAETNSESYGAKQLPEAISYIDIASVKQGRIISRTQMMATDAPGRARRKARSGDVIWSNVRPNLRAYALIMEPAEEDVFSTGFTILRPVSVPYTWLYQFVITENFIGYLNNHATGAGYPAVRPDDFERAEANIPTPQLLALFHEAIEPSMKMISKLNAQSDKLAQARDLLLPRLMSGEIAV
jgi:type I restriction enzyme, S subunit